MRRFRRDQRDQPGRRAARGRHPRRRADSRRRPGRPWLVLLPGAVLSLVVVSALVAPGFGVVVTGRGQPRPPDLGGPILVPTVTTAATPVPSPTMEEPAPIGAPLGAPTEVSAEQTRQRYLRELAARMSGQETPQRIAVRPDDAPAVTYRPLPAATTEPSAAPSPVPSEPGVTPVPSAPPRAPGRALPPATP
ncbi:hypothetical protein [Parafrankia sp. FMc2]|uniref:hypothetical protein n=1 Tax=Parafrankia sp. FMc2 TaxID=3233196 RepID=UPI0034D5CDC9